MDGKLVPGYRSLLDSCMRLVEGSYRNSRSELVAFYWEVGREINQALRCVRGLYGTATVRRLAHDLRISKTDLYNAMALATRFERTELAANLTWSHYRTLLTLGRESSRSLAVRAARERMPVARLRVEISRRRTGRDLRSIRDPTAVPARNELAVLLDLLKKIPDRSRMETVGLGSATPAIRVTVLQAVDSAEKNLREIRRFLAGGS